MTPWTWLAVALWIIPGLALVADEAHGFMHAEDGFPTLTNLVKRYVPRWVMAMVLGWLAWHFLAGKGGDR